MTICIMLELKIYNPEPKSPAFPDYNIQSAYISQITICGRYPEGEAICGVMVGMGSWVLSTGPYAFWASVIYNPQSLFGFKLFLIVYVHMSMHTWRSEDDSEKSAHSSHCVGPRNPTHLVKLSGKCFNLLIHFAMPCLAF